MALRQADKIANTQDSRLGYYNRLFLLKENVILE
jgi:hypothetical protein